jgi:single-strand selective monofunctional uracil DNA glycosylase
MPNSASLTETAGYLARYAASLSFAAPITHVYNPLEYAWAPHAMYLERYGAGPKEVLLVGMNPGPFGMAQTGVPFGDVAMVRDWLRIRGRVGHPAVEHPKRPVEGFACARGEVSGKRFWGWARDRFQRPERFFTRFFVWNYCPLCFMESSGRNFTPDKLPPGVRARLHAVCDSALVEVVRVLRPKYVLGVGGYSEQRARTCFGGCGIVIGRVPHPSPASPAANRGWERLMDEALSRLAIRV